MRDRRGKRPHLTLAEMLCRYEWLQTKDYADKETLCHAIWQALTAVSDAL